MKNAAIKNRGVGISGFVAQASLGDSEDNPLGLHAEAFDA
jgi:hypothetical protein